MPVYLEYALKVSICLAVSFFFYTLLLKRMTHYTWNRYFLLLFSGLSFVVPFINISTLIKPQSARSISLVESIPTLNAFEAVNEASGSHGMLVYGQILLVVFLLVSCILAVRLVVQFLSIQKIRSGATVVNVGEEMIYHIDGSVLPFSFLKGIYINVRNYQQVELQKIIDHERVHVQQRHSIDMLFFELLCVFNWYNPFAWMLKQAARENLEFIADDAVIRKGVDKKNYQYLLLKVTGDLPSAIASSFTFSSLKNRIVMMNKSRSSRFQLWKFGLLIPVIAMLLLAFRNSQKVSVGKSAVVKESNSEGYTLSTLTYSIADEKVKSIVLRDKDNSLLKAGELLNLKLIHNEKDRLQSLLESNGFSNLKSTAIRFMIDTASVDNSFSVEIKIDVEPAVAFVGDGKRKRFSVAAFCPQVVRLQPLHDLVSLRNEYVGC